MQVIEGLVAQDVLDNGRFFIDISNRCVLFTESVKIITCERAQLLLLLLLKLTCKRCLKCAFILLMLWHCKRCCCQSTTLVYHANWNIIYLYGDRGDLQDLATRIRFFGPRNFAAFAPVSYTHLTLPTIYSV